MREDRHFLCLRGVRDDHHFVPLGACHNSPCSLDLYYLCPSEVTMFKLGLPLGLLRLILAPDISLEGPRKSGFSSQTQLKGSCCKCLWWTLFYKISERETKKRKNENKINWVLNISIQCISLVFILLKLLHIFFTLQQQTELSSAGILLSSSVTLSQSYLDRYQRMHCRCAFHFTIVHHFEKKRKSAKT